MGRTLRTNIPCSLNLLKPKLTYLEDRKVIENNKIKTRIQYDKTAINRTNLVVGTEVMFKKKPLSFWSSGRVEDVSLEPRSYIVSDDNGKVFRRNEIHISPVSSTEHSNNSSNNAVNDQSFSDPPDSQEQFLIA